MNPIFELIDKHGSMTGHALDFATELEQLHANMTIYNNVRNGAKRSIVSDDSEFKKLLNTPIDCICHYNNSIKFVCPVPYRDVLTPLQYALTATQHTNIKIISSLIDHGADMHVRDSENCTPMMKLCERVIGTLTPYSERDKQTFIFELIKKYDIIRDSGSGIELVQYLVNTENDYIVNHRYHSTEYSSSELRDWLAISISREHECFRSFLVQLCNTIINKLNTEEKMRFYAHCTENWDLPCL
jgi:hypothetical protein